MPHSVATQAVFLKTNAALFGASASNTSARKMVCCTTLLAKCRNRPAAKMPPLDKSMPPLDESIPPQNVDTRIRPQAIREVLLSHTAWLNDDIVNAVLKLLRKANPAVPGLQDVCCGLTMNFDVEPGEFVQILHTGHGHWNTISTIGMKHAEVQVFDSVYMCVPTIAKAQIAVLLTTEEPSIKLNFMDVQMQSGGYDCGLFL